MLSVHLLVKSFEILYHEFLYVKLLFAQKGIIYSHVALEEDSKLVNQRRDLLWEKIADEIAILIEVYLKRLNENLCQVDYPLSTEEKDFQELVVSCEGFKANISSMNYYRRLLMNHLILNSLKTLFSNLPNSPLLILLILLTLLILSTLLLSLYNLLNWGIQLLSLGGWICPP